MKLKMITEGLEALLLENNYNPATIHFYKREWNKIQSFLMDEYGDSEFDMERGLKYLEKRYGFISKCNEGTLSQQRVQLLRIIHMLEDYSIHKVLTRRYFASKNPIVLNSYYSTVFTGYTTYLDSTELSATTKEHYKRSAMVLMDYFTQTKVLQTGKITMENCNAYLKTLAGYIFKTIEQNVCGIRHFLRYIYSESLIPENYAERIHMPPISKSAKIPSAWDADELTGLRHRVILTLLYDSGCRVQEMCDLTIADVFLNTHSTVRLHGKGNKFRTVVISDQTANLLKSYISRYLANALGNHPLVTNRYHQEIDRDGIGYIISKYVADIRRYNPSFPKKVHCHMFRHSKAVHMLEAGINIVYIRDFLGHEDISTTMIYVRTDNRLRNEAINRLSPKVTDDIEKLKKLDKEIESSFDKLEDRTLIIYHPSLGYFADDYGLTMVSIQSEGKDAAPDDLQKIIDMSKMHNIKAVFYQAEIDSRQSRTLADEIGGKAVQIAPLASDYIDNLKKIATEITCSNE